MLSQVTFGITAFERPRHLQRLHASIRRYYPEAHVVVANNGKSRLDAEITSAPNTEELKLPYDVGVSACRNTLADALDSDYLLILEDDFIFTEETKVERMLEVFVAEPTVGIVGGNAYSWCDEGVANIFDGFTPGVGFGLIGSRAPWRSTKTGVHYRYCEYVINFVMCRKQIFATARWDENLKLAEHGDFFFRFKRQGDWRVVYTPDVTLTHDHGGRSIEYRQMRGRSREFQEDVLWPKWEKALG